MNDLDWLAFRYIAGELAPDEAVRFELQLADDQQARDAVAQAFELSESVLAAEMLSPAVAVALTGRSRWQQVVWSAVAVAACLLLMFSSPFAQRSQPSDPLADAWGSQFSGEVNALSDAPELTTSSDAAELESEADVPGWMVEALRSMHAEHEDAENAADEIMES